MFCIPISVPENKLCSPQKQQVPLALHHLSRPSTCCFQWNLFFSYIWKIFMSFSLYCVHLSLISKLFRSSAAMPVWNSGAALHTQFHSGARTNVFKRRSSPATSHGRQDRVSWQIMLRDPWYMGCFVCTVLEEVKQKPLWFQGPLLSKFHGFLQIFLFPSTCF